MATWGAYFASYVKKNPAVATQEDVVDAPASSTIKSYKTKPSTGPSEDSFGLQRAGSDTRAKKLYSSPAEPTIRTDAGPQRAGSNAARVAKMFGYAKPKPALLGVVSEAVKAAQEAKSEEKVQMPRSPVLKEVFALQAEMEVDEGVKMSRSPLLAEGFALQAARAEMDRVDEARTQGVLLDRAINTLSIDLPTVLEKQRPVKSPVLLFASPESNVKKRQNSEAGKLDRSMQSPVFPAQNSKPRSKVPKSSLSSLDDLMTLLETESFMPIKHQARKEILTPSRTSVKREQNKSSVAKTSLSSLDEMMAALEQDWNVESKSTPTAIDQQTPRAIQPQAQNFGLESQVMDISRFVDEPKEMEISRTTISSLRESFTSVYREDSFSGSYRKDSLTSSVSSAWSASRPYPDVQYSIPTYIDEEKSAVMEKPILEYIQEVSEMALERQRMSEERHVIREEEMALRRQEERFAEEEEQMQIFVESLRMEEKADLENRERIARIAEENEVERQRIEKERRGEEERLADEKRRVEEERLAVEMVERLNAENNRIERERREKERAYLERVEMERQSYVEEEARLREERMGEEKLIRAEEENQLQRLRYEEAQIDLRQMEAEEAAMQARRAEEGRSDRERFQEEEDRRLENEMLERERYEEEVRFEREQYEDGQRLEDERTRYEEEEAMEGQRLDAMRQAEERWQAEQAQARRYEEEEEEAQRDYQHRENELKLQETRRAEIERAGSLQYQEAQKAFNVQRQTYEDLEPEVLTKEQELAKAEEKIRAAFVGLAQERQLLSKPDISPQTPQKADDAGIAKYNTVAAATQPRQEVVKGILRGNTVGGNAMSVRPNIPGGLPNGPKGGFGLPSGPKVGVPFAPRPARRAI